MVDFPGYSLSGVVASFFFIMLTMKQSVCPSGKHTGQDIRRRGFKTGCTRKYGMECGSLPSGECTSFTCESSQPDDDFRVVGPAHPILARVGEDALLTCQLLPKRTAVHMQVRWYRLEPSIQIAHRVGAEVPEMQTEDHRGRVQWVEDDFAEGTVALKMRNIRPSDDGQYWCHFQEGNYLGETSLLLKVAGLGSAPHIHMEGSEEGEIQLVCTAEGWFPEPQVYWEDMKGEKLLTFSEYHIQDEEGLFYVEAMLIIRNASTETVSCFIHNPVLAEEKGSVISIPEKLQSELASLKVIGPSQPLLVRVGEDIQLTCYLSPKANAQSMEVRWVRSHRYPAVYVHVDGDHVYKEQMAEYRGRTVLVADALNEGRLTLHIHNASTSDDGEYRCLFEKDGVYQESSLDLKVVGLGSFPRITMEGPKDGQMQLMCSSEGWFPQPHVQWRDTEGKTVPSFSEVLTPDSRGLFHVEAFLLVANSSAVNVTCSVSNPLLGEEKMATFSPSDSRMTFSWLLLLIFGLLLLAAVGLIKRKSCRNVNVTPIQIQLPKNGSFLRGRSMRPTDCHATIYPQR